MYNTQVKKAMQELFVSYFNHSLSLFYDYKTKPAKFNLHINKVHCNTR